MKGLIVFNLTILLVTLGLTQGQVTEPCITQIDSCSCKTKSGYINLHPLDMASRNGTAYFSNMQSDDGYNYYFNPCTAFTMETCHNVSACQMDQKGVMFALGSQESAQFVVSSASNTNTIQYQYNSIDGNRILKVNLICDYVKGNMRFIKEGPKLTYIMELTTRYACADFAPYPFNNETTTMTSPGGHSTTTTTDDCHCDEGDNITWILITVVVATFCLCLLMLVAAILVVIVRRYSIPTGTPINSSTGDNHYQKL